MTYALVNAVFLALAGAAVVACARRRPGRLHAGAVLAAIVVLVVLTAVFDNVMIAAGLFEYSAEGRSGLSVGRAPVEDFAYPLAGALALPALWHLLERRGAAGRADVGRRDAGRRGAGRAHTRRRDAGTGKGHR